MRIDFTVSDLLPSSALRKVAPLAAGLSLLVACGDDPPSPDCGVGERCECAAPVDCPDPTVEDCDLFSGVCVPRTGDGDTGDTDTDVMDVPDTDVPDTTPDVVEEVTPDVTDTTPDADTTPDTTPDAEVGVDADADTMDVEVEEEVDVPDVETDIGPIAPDPVNNPWIAFVARDGLDLVYIVRADGTGRTQVDTGDLIQFDPSWAPDGRRLALSTVLPSGQVIKIIDVTTGVITTLDPELYSFSGITWSPDGTQIAIEGSAEASALNDIYIVDTETGETEQLTDTATSEAAPDWVQPHLLYYLSNSFGEFEIVSHNLNTDEVERITSGSDVVGSPSVSWDGSIILYNRRLGDDSGELVKLDTTSFATSTIGTDNARDAEISPDGLWLALTDDVGENRDILLFDMTSLTEIAQVTDDDLPESSLSIASVESETVILAIGDE